MQSTPPFVTQPLLWRSSRSAKWGRPGFKLRSGSPRGGTRAANLHRPFDNTQLEPCRSSEREPFTLRLWHRSHAFLTRFAFARRLGPSGGAVGCPLATGRVGRELVEAMGVAITCCAPENCQCAAPPPSAPNGPVGHKATRVPHCCSQEWNRRAPLSVKVGLRGVCGVRCGERNESSVDVGPRPARTPEGSFSFLADKAHDCPLKVKDSQ